MNYVKVSLFFIFLLIVSLPVIAHLGEEHIELPTGLQKLFDSEKEKALSITFLAVFIAGLVAITSPCGFVIIPTYIATVFRNRKRILLASTAFSIGIIIMFTILGIIASIVGSFFNSFKEYFAVISGIAIMIFGIMIFLNKGFSIFTPKIDHNKKGFFNYVLFGIFFAGGWTPCIGPIVGSVLFLAANMGSMIKATTLLIVYGLGVVIPLIIVSLIADKYDITKYIQGKSREIKLFGKKIHTTTYNIVSAIILLIVGSVILIYKGTSLLESYIQTVTPWSMSILLKVNYLVQNSEFMKTQTANVIGIIIALSVIIFLIYKIRKNNS